MIYQLSQLLRVDLEVKVAAHTTWKGYTLWSIGGVRDEGNASCLVFVLSSGVKVLHTRQCPWLANSPVTSLCFSPCSKWLLISTGKSLHILSTAYSYNIPLTEDSSNRPWMTNDITEITSNLQTVTAVSWWTSYRNEDFAVLVTKRGQFKIIDLITGEEKVSLNVRGELVHVDICPTSKDVSRVCLLTSRSGAQWLIRLEQKHLPRLRALTDCDEEENHGFEQLDLDILSPVDIVTEGRAASRESGDVITEFSPQVCSKHVPRSVTLQLHPVDYQVTFLSSYDSNRGILKLMEAGADLGLSPLSVQSTPLFMYGLPRQCSAIRITRRLLIAVYPVAAASEGGVRPLRLGVFLRQHAHISLDTSSVCDTSLLRSKLVELPLDTTEHELSARLVSLWCRSKFDDVEDFAERVWCPSGTDDGHKWPLDNPLRLTEINLMTEQCAVVCRQVFWAETEFLSSLISTHVSPIGSPCVSSKSAEWLGIGLKLDLATLYTLAGRELLSRECFNAAAECFHEARTPVHERLEMCDHLQPSVMLRFLQHNFSLAVNRDGELSMSAAEARILCRAIIICACSNSTSSDALSFPNSGSSLQDLLSRLYDKWMVPPVCLLQPESLLQPMAELGRVPELLLLARRSGCIASALTVLKNTRWGCGPIRESDSELAAEYSPLAEAALFQHTLSCIQTSDLEAIIPDCVECLRSFAETASNFLTRLRGKDVLLHLADLTDPSSTHCCTLHALAKRSRHHQRSSNLSMSQSVRLAAPANRRDSAAHLAISESEQLQAIEEVPIRDVTSTWINLFIETILELETRESQQGDEFVGVDLEFIKLFGESSDSSRPSPSNQTCVVDCPAIEMKGGRDYLVLIEKGEVELCLGKIPPQALSSLQQSGSRVASLACGSRHALLQLADTGKVMAVGDNEFGQLGIGESVAKVTSSKSPLPVLFPDENQSVIKISCGHFHSLALLGNGRPVAWGWAVHGQLGNEDIEDKAQPIDMILPDWMSRDNIQVASLSGGLYHTVLLTSTGHVLACGDNHFGQLGVSDEFLQKSSLLRPVPGFGDDGTNHHAVMLHTQYFHCVVVDEDQKVFIWGHPPYMRRQGGRRHGQPSWADSWAPQQVDTSLLNQSESGSIVKALCGSNHCMFLTDKGVLFSAGKNIHGQLGAGHKRDIVLTLERVQFTSNVQVTDLFCEDSYSAAVTSDSRILVWGRGSHPLSSSEDTSESYSIGGMDCAVPRPLFNQVQFREPLKSQFSVSSNCHTRRATCLLPLLRAHLPLVHRKKLIGTLQRRASLIGQWHACAVLSDFLLAERRFLKSLFWRRKQLLLILSGKDTTNFQSLLIENVSSIIRFYLTAFSEIESETLYNQELNAGFHMILHLWNNDLHLPLPQLENLLTEHFHQLAGILVKLVLSPSSPFSLQFTLQLLCHLLKHDNSQYSRWLPPSQETSMSLIKMELSATDLNKWTEELMQEDSVSIYADDDATEQRQIVVFKCGHRLSRRVLFERDVLNLCASLEHLDLPVTAKLAKHYYSRDRILLTCPKCLITRAREDNI